MKRARDNNEYTNKLHQYSNLLFRENKHRLAKSDYNGPLLLAQQLQDASAQNDAMAKCHAIMDRVREYLEIFDEKWGARTNERFERSRDQRIIHDTIIGAVAKFVYGDLYGPNEILIRKYNRLPAVHAAIAFTAPRRVGKSMAIAIICAVLFMTVPGMEIVILAQGSRAAGKKAGMLGLIKEILRECFNFEKADFDTEDKENLIAFFPDRRAIHAYSSKAGDKYVLP